MSFETGMSPDEIFDDIVQKFNLSQVEERKLNDFYMSLFGSYLETLEKKSGFLDKLSTKFGRYPNLYYDPDMLTIVLKYINPYNKPIISVETLNIQWIDENGDLHPFRDLIRNHFLPFIILHIEDVNDPFSYTVFPRVLDTYRQYYIDYYDYISAVLTPLDQVFLKMRNVDTINYVCGSEEYFDSVVEMIKKRFDLGFSDRISDEMTWWFVQNYLYYGVDLSNVCFAGFSKDYNRIYTVESVNGSDWYHRVISVPDDFNDPDYSRFIGSVLDFTENSFVRWFVYNNENSRFEWYIELPFSDEIMNIISNL